MVAAPLEGQGLDATLCGLLLPGGPVDQAHGVVGVDGGQQALFDLLQRQASGRVGRPVDSCVQGGAGRVGSAQAAALLGRAKGGLQGGQDGAGRRGQTQALGQKTMDQAGCVEPPAVAGSQGYLRAGEVRLRRGSGAHGVATGGQGALQASWIGGANAGQVAGQALAQVRPEGAVGPERVQVGGRRGVQQQGGAQLYPAQRAGPGQQARLLGLAERRGDEAPPQRPQTRQLTSLAEARARETGVMRRRGPGSRSVQGARLRIAAREGGAPAGSARTRSASDVRCCGASRGGAASWSLISQAPKGVSRGGAAATRAASAATRPSPASGPLSRSCTWVRRASPPCSRSHQGRRPVRSPEPARGR